MVDVDVIVPCYNYARFLEQCVRSVLHNQEVPSLRVLIIDDASSDDTSQVAQSLASRDSRITFRRHQTNHGHISTYNEGIEWASAKYMLLLSADDYLMPGALLRASSLMEAHPEVGFTFGNVLELREDGSIVPTRSVIKTVADTDKRILRGHELIELTGAEGNQVTTCSAVVRTEVQKSVGLYRKELPHAGDVEMWLRFAAHSSVGFIFDYQGIYRRHSSSMSAAYYIVSGDRTIYQKNGRLANLQQCKVAFDFFSEHSRGVMPRHDDICRRLYRQLSQSAVSHASAAFNDGEMAECRELSDFAVAVCPEIRASSAWLKLNSKRWMGRRIWRAVKPVAAAIRAI
jgi:glycosyltransferase involved in cell wall biosynthesis